MSAEQQDTEAAAVAAIAVNGCAAKPVAVDPEKLYVTFDPEDGTHAVLDLSEYRETPKALKGTVRLATLASFVDYVSAHADSKSTTLWVDQAAFNIVAVLDDHEPGAAHWGHHRAELTLRQTPEWKHWTSQSDRWMNQEAFAEHVQDGISEIHEPAAADMLEIAQTFQGKTKVEWRSAKRISNGEVQFAYHEEVTGSAGKSGDMTIPQVIKLVLAPFVGEEPKLIQARLRYRVKEGTLSLSYKLERPHEILDAAVIEIAEKLKDCAAFSHVYLGTPRQ